MSANKESWGTRIGLILAMAGNAVGLGNFLRFPVQAVQNGGGAFIIPYLICFLVMGIPLLLIEWGIGRHGGQFGHHSTPFMMQSLDKRRIWKYIGVFGIFSNIGIAAYYCFIESWTLSYAMHSAMGTFFDKTQPQVVEFFDHYVSVNHTVLLPFEAVIFYILCLFLNVYILSKGLSQGIEKVAKILMPLLIVFGIFLAIKSLSIKAGEQGATFDGVMGLNFLWTPDYSSIANPRVWLNAAGQVFFTLSIGMGSVHCFASFVKQNDDIALNSMTAGWTNEFVEVVLGSSIIIPVAIGYLGIDKLKELAELGGLAIGFRTMPYLFDQWGHIFGAVAGVMWFGLLFFAGITSSLAMGMPVMSFMKDEYGFSQKKAAYTFGLITLLLGLPTVFFFKQGVFDEYDFWTGTVSLFVFAAAETILFVWVFGMKKGWAEISRGADIKLPVIYKYIMKFVTPVFLLAVFFGAIFKPEKNDWSGAFSKLFSGEGWSLDNGSIIKQILNSELREKIAATSDLVLREELQEKLFLSIGAKILLATVFLVIAFFVHKAAKRKNILTSHQ